MIWVLYIHLTGREAAGMSVEHSNQIDNPNSQNSQTPEQAAKQLQECCESFRQVAMDAASAGKSFDQTEREVWSLVLKTGFRAMELFTKLQGVGDIGQQTTTDHGKTLRRSRRPTETVVRSMFETAKKRPGNRRMATVTSVYTVDQHIRTAEQIVEALFRTEKEPAPKSIKRKSKKRPRPKNKQTSAHLPTTFVDPNRNLINHYTPLTLAC